MADGDAELQIESNALVAPREAWYAAIASQRLADKPIAARILDHDVALWRDASGVPHAAQDRCAHRGAQLSLGEVTDGSLACRYHGWRYGPDGACTHIPSLLSGQSIPRGVSVRGYPCFERDGYVWTWMGDAAPVGEPAPIDHFGAYDWVQGVVMLRASALAAIENNLDWCHPVFAHPFTHSQFFMNQALGFQEYDIEVRLTGRGVMVFFPASATDDDAPAPSVSLNYELPDRVTVGFANRGGGGPLRVVLHMVPTGPGTCRQEWLIAVTPASGDAPNVQWTDEPNSIFEQDRLVLESAQLAFDREGHGFERSVEADAPTLLARRVWTAAAQGRWPQDRARLTQRRVLKVRN